MSDTEFTFPWQYDFPPFFTIQPNLTSRKAQMDAWASLIMAWCCHEKRHTLQLKQAISEPLFNNKKIGRQLTLQSLNVIFDEMKKRSLIEWSDDDKSTCYVYWKSVEEWAQLIYSWANNQNLINSVCTFYEITESDDNKELPFYHLDENVLRKALSVLQSKKKAVLIEFDGNQGVKFL